MLMSQDDKIEVTLNLTQTLKNGIYLIVSNASMIKWNVNSVLFS